MSIVLASTSPQRKALIKKLNQPFLVCAPKFEELSHPNLSPQQEVEWLALQKARSLADDFPKDIIIGCDTMVVFQNKKFGKPNNIEEATKMLKLFRGKTHLVLSGLALFQANPQKELVRVITSKVKMKNYSDQDILTYLQTGESFGKAGSYAIQGKGKQFIESFSGDYDNIVGLPLDALREALSDF